VDASLGGTVVRGMVRLLWSFKCSKHGFHVLAALYNRIPLKTMLSKYAAKWADWAATGRQHPTPTPQLCSTFAKHGLHPSRL